VKEKERKMSKKMYKQNWRGMWAKERRKKEGAGG
jgi:hypothetical protein